MGKKSINVKVRREKVIAALQEAMDKRVAEVKKYDDAKAKHDELMKSWISEAVAAINGEDVTERNGQMRTWVDNGGRRYVEVSAYVKPEALRLQPEFTPPDGHARRHTNENAIEEMKHALLVLGMSEEEFVSASTYASVIQYL
jgi:hypothetical protein